MTVSPFLFPIFRAFDSNGDPLSGGKVYTYSAGTTTPKSTYTDSTGGTPNANPVILDSEGYASIWGEGTYKIVIKDSNDVTIETIDNFSNDRGATGAAGTFQMVDAGGTVDAITANYSPDVSLSDLTTVGFRSTGANTSTTPTFAPDGLTARTIVKRGGTALVAGDIGPDGSIHVLTYDLANTRWELHNPAVSTSVLGTSTNDNAATGYVGQVIESTLSIGSATSLTTATAKTITSISLTAGDWDVWGNIGFIPAGTTSTTLLRGSISQTNNTHATSPNGGAFFEMPFAAYVSGGVAFAEPVGMTRISLSSTTTIYLVATATFTVSTMTAYGYIGARRRR